LPLDGYYRPPVIDYDGIVPNVDIDAAKHLLEAEAEAAKSDASPFTKPKPGKHAATDARQPTTSSPQDPPDLDEESGDLNDQHQHEDASGVPEPAGVPPAATSTEPTNDTPSPEEEAIHARLLEAENNGTKIGTGGIYYECPSPEWSGFESDDAAEAEERNKLISSFLPIPIGRLRDATIVDNEFSRAPASSTTPTPQYDTDDVPLEEPAMASVGPGGDQRRRPDYPIIDPPDVNRLEAVDDYQTKGLLAKGFPHLFPRGVAADLRQRTVPVNEKELFTHLLKFHDARFAQDCRFIFFAYNTMKRHRANSRGNFYLKRHPELLSMDREQFEAMTAAKRQTFIENVLSFRSSDAGTKSYWHTRKTELLAMVGSLGLPAFFVTVSAADIQWPDLHQHIPGSGEPGYSKSGGVIENPMICNRYTILKLQAAIEEIIKKDFGANESWIKVEWQHRGSPHLHCLIWVKEVTDLYVDNNGDVVTVLAPENKTKLLDILNRRIQTWNPALDEDGKGDTTVCDPHPSSANMINLPNSCWQTELTEKEEAEAVPAKKAAH
jgi:hypothetical protein